MTAALHGQTPQQPPLEPDLVRRALATELQAAQDDSHPMRYFLRKSSPRLATTKQIIETRDGAVAQLVSTNGHPPSDDDRRKDDSRLNDLLADSGKQRHRKQSEDADAARILRVLRALPVAFNYEYAGTVAATSGPADRFLFTPAPGFEPPDLETQVLPAMSGEIWIDPAQVRVVRLQAHLTRDVNFGWGVLGRLYKGGWITIDQADVSSGVWRVTKLQMSMSARVLIRTRSFDTTEEQSRFQPISPALDYRQAIAMLRNSAPQTPEPVPNH